MSSDKQVSKKCLLLSYYYEMNNSLRCELTERLFLYLVQTMTVGLEKFKIG